MLSCYARTSESKNCILYNFDILLCDQAFINYVTTHFVLCLQLNNVQHTHTYIHAYIHTYTHMRMHTHVCAHSQHMHTHTYIHTKLYFKKLENSSHSIIASELIPIPFAKKGSYKVPVKSVPLSKTKALVTLQFLKTNTTNKQTNNKKQSQSLQQQSSNR